MTLTKDHEYTADYEYWLGSATFRGRGRSASDPALDIEGLRPTRIFLCLGNLKKKNCLQSRWALRLMTFLGFHKFRSNKQMPVEISDIIWIFVTVTHFRVIPPPMSTNIFLILRWGSVILTSKQVVTFLPINLYLKAAHWKKKFANFLLNFVYDTPFIIVIPIALFVNNAKRPPPNWVPPQAPLFMAGYWLGCIIL